jgi:hypothetical protein
VSGRGLWVGIVLIVALIAGLLGLFLVLLALFYTIYGIVLLWKAFIWIVSGAWVGAG